MKERSLWTRMASLMLAVVMLVSVVTVMPETVSAADRAIKGSGSSSVTITDEECYGMPAYGYGTGDYIYIRFKAKANGYVTFSISNASLLDTYTDGYMALCNASKTQISSLTSFDSRSDESYKKSAVYGVKRNQTYYLRVLAYVGARVDAKFTKVTEKSGSKKSKAKNMAKGKTVKGVIPAGSKEEDWYKFKITKSQYLKISYSAKTNRGIKLTVYEGKRNLGTAEMDYTSSKTRSTYIVNYYTKKKIKVDPGTTYYIKVQRYDSQSSGYYTLKWN